MKRVAALLALAFAVAAAGSPASADDEVPMNDPWGGSNVAPVPAITGPTTGLVVTGRIKNGEGRPDSVAYAPPPVAVTFDPDISTGCNLSPDGPATAAEIGSAESGGDVTTGWTAYAYRADVVYVADRNGTYPLYVCINGRHRLDTDVLVRLPAPTVTNLVTSADGHQVALSWDDMRIGAPDVSGYRIERSVGGEPFEPVATIGPETPSFTDTTLPAAGGEATYQVVALRPHVADAAPSATSTATFAAGPATPGTTGTGAGSGAGGAGGTPAPGAAPGRSGSSGGGGPTVAAGPTIRIPRVGTPSRNFFPALLAPPAGAEGFTETLPYEEPGDVVGEELASDPLDEALPGRGLAIPVATGLVLAAWALHLRFLARASRPEYQDPIEIFLER